MRIGFMRNRNGWSDGILVACMALMPVLCAAETLVELGTPFLDNAVLQKVYGFKDITSCPLYTKHAIEGSSIRVSFDNAQHGLMVAKKEGFPPPAPQPDAAIQWLSIQAKDGQPIGPFSTIGYGPEMPQGSR